jgi:outer membrane protein assembly factor BamB
MKRLALIAAALLAACSTGSSGPKPATLPPLTNPQNVKLLWSASVGEADRFVFSPALAGGSIYAAARNGTVTRLDAASGKQAWRISTPVRLSGGVGADDRTVAIATEEGEVLALEADSGKLRWRARVSSEVLSAPTVGRGLVLVRSIDSRVFAFDATDGKRRWVYQRPASPLAVRTPAGAVMRDDTAFMGFRGGKLVALSLTNGGVRWEATVAVPKGTTELERVVDVVGDPALQGREVCAAAYQGRVACFDAATGQQAWARESSSLTGVSVDPRFAYVADDRGSVQSFDRSNGRTVWKQDRLSLRQLTLPLPVESAVAVGDFEGYVHFLARDTGAFIARYDARGGGIAAAPLSIPGGLLVQTRNGSLVALAL